MHILMLTPAFHPLTGGVERHVRRISEELSTMGHAVTVITRACPGAPSCERLGEIDVVRLQGGIRALPALWKNHRRLFTQADIVHCHDAYPFLYWHSPMRLLLGLRRAFVTFHGYERWPPPHEAIALRRRVRKMCAGALAAGAFIPHWYGTPCDAVTYGGVDLPADPIPEEPEPRAIFVGRLERDTGVLNYLRLLSLARTRHGVNLPLDICGDGSLREEIQRIADAEGLDVHLHGWIPDPMRLLLGAKFALVSGYLAMWEAMACGAIVLALYDNPLKRDYLEVFPGSVDAGDTGPVVTVCGSPESGAGQLAYLLAHPKEMRARAQAGRALAAERTWRRVAEQYLSLWAGET